MPGRRARQLCPDLVFVGGHFREYQRLGDAAIGVLSDFTPSIERISIDEAFADVAGCTHLFGSPAEIAKSVRARVHAELGLPISIGVAGTKHLAKIASQVAKPDGLVVVDPETELEFLHELPVALMWAWAPHRGAARQDRRHHHRSIGGELSCVRGAIAWARGGKKADGTRVEPRSAAHPDAPARALCRRTIGARTTACDRARLQTDAPSSRRPHRRAARANHWRAGRSCLPVRIAPGVSFEQACFVEPVNTCLKGIETLKLQPGETVLVIGQGPIGMILGVLAKRTGATVVTTDLYAGRLTISKQLGLVQTIDASRTDPVKAVRELTEGRGADAAILAVGGNGLIRSAMDAVRPGGRVLLFAQTVRGESTIDPAAVCVDEKTLLGSYSASVELQEQSVRFVMDQEMDLARLISHRFPLSGGIEALHLAAHPQPDSMKIVIQPGSSWEGS